jgi:LCP family protein required for cell wall assembly
VRRTPAHRETRARHVAARRPLRRALRALAITLAVILVTGTAGAFAAYVKLDSNIVSKDLTKQLGKDRPKVIAEGPKKPRNIVIIGSDKRTGKAAENPNVSGQRSDTTILLHLAADRKSAVLVSIPRDSVVAMPSCIREDGSTMPAQSAQMFNAAFAEGGAACTIRTIEKLTQIHVDNYVVVDFNGFKNMVNALDGVEVCLPQDVNDRDSHLHLTKGRHIVKGTQALAYVRNRHGLGNGSDIGRIDRQQAFLSSMVTKVQSTGLLLRPDRLLRFLDAATKSITTDPGLASLNELRKLAQSVKGLKSDAVTFVTVPTKGYPLNPNRVVWKSSAAALWTSIRYDQPLPGHGPKPTTPTPTTSASGPALVTTPQSIRVQVLNGSGVAGAASRMAQELEAQGYVVVRVGTADRSDYATTVVRHDPAYDESGRTLSASIPGSQVEVDAALSRSLVVIVGADHPTVVPVTVAGSPSATSTPTAEATIPTRKANQDICS